MEGANLITTYMTRCKFSHLVIYVALIVTCCTMTKMTLALHVWQYARNYTLRLVYCHPLEEKETHETNGQGDNRYCRFKRTAMSLFEILAINIVDV